MTVIMGNRLANAMSPKPSVNGFRPVDRAGEAHSERRDQGDRNRRCRNAARVVCDSDDALSPARSRSWWSRSQHDTEVTPDDEVVDGPAFDDSKGADHQRNRLPRPRRSFSTRWRIPDARLPWAGQYRLPPPPWLPPRKRRSGPAVPPPSSQIRGRMRRSGARTGFPSGRSRTPVHGREGREPYRARE